MSLKGRISGGVDVIAQHLGTQEDVSTITAQEGMSIAERLELLHSDPGNPPERVINLGEDVDPFGLESHNDTYEVIAGALFKDCEGLFATCTLTDPDVAAQVKSQRKNPNKRILLPETKLGNFYTYRMTRIEDDMKVLYRFNRSDPGHENSGFEVLRNGNGHMLLKHINQGETDPSNDEQYYRLLHKAHQWIQEYAAAQHIDPTKLHALAEQDFGAYNKRQELVNRALASLKSPKEVAVNGILAATTVRMYDFDYNRNNNTYGRHGSRRPRMAALLVAAALIPTSSSTIVAETVGSGIIHYDWSGNRGRDTKIRNFDEQHWRLPAGATTVRLGQTSGVKFVGDVSESIRKAPIFPSKFNDGSIRRFSKDKLGQDIPIGDNYSYPGLQPGLCAPEIAVNLPSGTTADVLNNDAESGANLSISLTSDAITICDFGKDAVGTDTLNRVYIQFHEKK